MAPGYTHTDPFDTGRLPVSDIHSLAYWQYGNPKGKSALFLHGGPGGGTSKLSTAFFDPAVYRVILLDQRGAGKSTPVADLRENTTQLLIEDIELLRQRLLVEKWHVVFGGSWGSTLALAYAEAHPDFVGSLVLRGIFLEMNNSVAQALFPDEFEKFINFLPESERADPYEGYADRILIGDRQTQLEFGKAWNRWEMFASSLALDEETAFKKLEDEDWVLAHARLAAHYFKYQLFLEEGQLVSEVDKVKHIPMSIVQGRYDAVCPPSDAWKLHKALPDSKLYIMRDSGHSAKDPGNFAKLTEVCDEYGKENFS